MTQAHDWEADDGSDDVIIEIRCGHCEKEHTIETSVSYLADKHVEYEECRECTVCHELDSYEEFEECGQCGELMCDEHTEEISNGEESACTECVEASGMYSECAVCNYLFTESDVYECEQCSDLVCEQHLNWIDDPAGDTHECDSCYMERVNEEKETQKKYEEEIEAVTKDTDKDDDFEHDLAYGRITG